MGTIDGPRGGIFKPFPGQLSGGWVPGRNRQCSLRSSHAFAEGDRAAYDHEEIVGVGPLIGHDELEVHAKELPPEKVVMLGFDDLPEPDRHDNGVSSGLAQVDSMACDRVERIEIHHVLARLAVDPGDRWLTRQQAKMIPEILRNGMKPHNGEIAADRQQGDTRAMPSETGINLERTRQNFRCEERTRTMAN